MILVRGWKWYQKCLFTHPLKTQIVSSGILWGVGDIAAQTVTRSSLSLSSSSISKISPHDTVIFIIIVISCYLISYHFFFFFFTFWAGVWFNRTFFLFSNSRVFFCFVFLNKICSMDCMFSLMLPLLDAYSSIYRVIFKIHAQITKYVNVCYFSYLDFLKWISSSFAHIKLVPHLLQLTFYIWNIYMLFFWLHWFFFGQTFLLCFWHIPFLSFFSFIFF